MALLKGKLLVGKAGTLKMESCRQTAGLRA